MKPQQWIFHNNPRVWRQLPPISFISPTRRSRCFGSSSSPATYKPLPVLHDVNIDQFRKEYFTPELPVLLPRQYFLNCLPAFERWFQRSSSTVNALPQQLNTSYLSQHSTTDTLVPLELTTTTAQSPSTESGSSVQQPPTEAADSFATSFRHFHAPLTLFLEWIRTVETSQTPQAHSTRLYLAQCQLLDLPPILRDDFPTPELVALAGKGDVYDTNLWIGYPPTYTPLHRDPNPNLFVQLAGRKVVRLLAPGDGQQVFSSVRRQLGRRGDHEAAAFRGEDMMKGAERDLLERAVWGDKGKDRDGVDVERCEGFEASLEAGDGLFIPKGWWHSIKGVGDTVTASVNWWFR